MTSVLVVITLLYGSLGIVSGSPLYPVTAGLPAEGRLAAFGDINSDLHSDLFYVVPTPNGTYQVWCYLWGGGSYNFLSTAVIVEPSAISGVIPGDFNHDGHLDVLVSGVNRTATPEGSNQTQTQSWLHLYLGNLYSYTSGPIVLPPALDEVLMMDANGDQWPDLFGAAWPGGARTFWVNDALPPNTNTVTFTLQQQALTNSSAPPGSAGAMWSGGALSALTSPHSNAFVDLDGDCLADLFVTSLDPVTLSTQFEIWINHKANGFVLTQVYPTRPGTTQVTFMDFDGNGALDMVFGVCWPNTSCARENTLHILYNQQLPMCSSEWSPGSGCRAQDSLCSADPNFVFGNASGVVNDPLHTVVPAAAFYDSNQQVDPYAVGEPYGALTLRAGDVDLDGFPDLLIGRRRAADPSETYVSLWLNVECGLDVPVACDPQAYAAGRRTFLHNLEWSSDLEAVADAYAGAWIDVGDDGKVDIVLLKQKPQPQADGADAADSASSVLYSSELIYNDLNLDALFLTTLVSNGVCDNWCPAPQPQFPDPKPYGVNYPGASIKFTVTDMGGTKQAHMGAQLPQSAFASLQTPYNVYGLGRTSNYIEEFYVGVPINYPTHWNMWVAMIPNSQLVVFPYPPDSPVDWTLELFISPSSRVLMVCIALASTLVGLAGIIGYFHYQERKEDEAEKKQSEHLFAF